MRKVVKIVAAILAFFAMLIVACLGYAKWRAHLPSDKKAEAFFRAHRRELAALAAAVERNPKMNFVSAEWAGSGSQAEDPAHVACAKLLKSVGAQFLRRRDGGVEIYLWGAGSAIGHDSYEGYAFITPDAPILKYAKVTRSLQNKALWVGTEKSRTGSFSNPQARLLVKDRPVPWH